MEAISYEGVEVAAVVAAESSVVGEDEASVVGTIEGSSMMRVRVDKVGFDDSDYSVVVKNRGLPPNPWRWEIYRAGRSSPIRQSPIFFRTMAAANKAGKAALKQLLAELNS